MMALRYRSVLLWFLALAVSTLGCSACAATMQFQSLPAQNQIRITYGDLEITFADQAHGFAVNGIRHLGFSSQFGRYPTTGTSAELWKVKFSYDAGFSGAFQELTNLSPANRSYSFDPNEGLTLFFNDLDLPGNTNSIDVTVRIKPQEQPGMTAWTIEVSNSSNIHAVWHVKFPIINFASIDGNGQNSWLVVPRREGLYKTNPVNSIDGWWGDENYGLLYPDTYQMQYCAYYRKSSGNFYYPDPNRGPGLYLAADDGAPWPKTFFFKSDPGNNLWTYSCNNQPNDVSTIGADYVMSYNHVIGVFAGDWFDASKIYRNWALQQSWTQKGPLVSRTDIPDWFKNITVVQKASTSNCTCGGSTVSNIYTYAVDLNNRVHGTMPVVWYTWDVLAATCGVGSCQFPPMVDALPGVDNVISDLQDQNIPVFLYADILIWDKNSPGWSEAQNYTIKKPDGSISYWDVGIAYMDYGTSFWRNYLSNVCKQIVQQHGVKGLYLDQAGKINQPDYDPSKGNPLGLTRSSVVVSHQAHEEIAAAVHSVDPEVMLWGEACPEFIMDVLHGKVMRHSILEGMVPMFSTVYHDYWTYFGRAQGFVDPVPFNPEGEMEAGWQFTIGAQIGRIWPNNYGRPDGQRLLNYISYLTQLKLDASDYLIFGQRMRPPLIDPNTIPELVMSPAEDGGTVKLPAVLASVWRGVSGKLALAVTNMYSQPLTFDVVMDLDEYGVQNAPAYHLYELGEPNSRICASTDRLLQFQLTLGPLDAKVYELLVSNCIEFDEMDFSRDCYINFQDFAIFAGDWLACTHPDNVDCENLLY
ncbi:MAG: DUF6259 domain-containing protein [Planctomycetota bacterium]